MKILLIPDSFKGSLSSKEVAEALKRGLKKVLRKTEIEIKPFADGGEGFVEALYYSIGGKLKRKEVTSPLINRKTRGKYLLWKDYAVIEMAQASGLNLLKREEYAPLYTTTKGTGELIRDAIERGIKKIILGLGGSATVDFGAGILSQLGIKLLDRNGKEIQPSGGFLNRIRRIEFEEFYKKIKNKIEFIIASDVKNPLLGKEGAVNAYAPQKGAGPREIKILNKNFEYFANFIKREYKIDVGSFKGGGAAGGISAGLKAFFKNIKIKSGGKLFFELTGLDKKINQYDILITGEGKIDRQTLKGKAVKVVLDFAKKYNNKKVIAVCGCLENGFEQLYKMGIWHIEPILNCPMTLEESMKNARKLLELTGIRIGFLLKNTIL